MSEWVSGAGYFRCRVYQRPHSRCACRGRKGETLLAPTPTGLFNSELQGLLETKEDHRRALGIGLQKGETLTRLAGGYEPRGGVPRTRGVKSVVLS